MRRFEKIALLLLAGAALPACSALGLDHLPQADCTLAADPDAFCASLVDHNPNIDACHTWQCNSLTTHCEQLPLDVDGDGAPAMMCAGPTDHADCDDNDPHNTPGATETCNGRDDDCDGIPDDGMNVIMVASTPLGTVDNAPAQLAFAMQPDSTEAYLLTRSSNTFTGTTITTSAMPATIAITQTGTGAIVPQAADGAVGALGSQRYALVVRRFNAGCQQWSVLPARSGTGGVTLRASDASLLPDCPTGGGTQTLTAPAVAGYATGGAAASDIVLGAWLDGADDPRSCGAAPARQVTLGAAILNDQTATGSRVGTTTLPLGMSVSDGPPVILALDDSFLVAYARADMTIAVHQITVAVDATTITISEVGTAYVEPAGAMVPQSIGLARGATASGATTIALSWITGCGGQNPITVRMLSRTATAVTGSGTPTTNLGSGLARSRVQVAFQPRVNEWIVGWRSASGVSAQRLFEEGAIEGDPIDVVSSSMVSAFVIEPLATGALYRALVVDGTALNQLSFGCGGS
jgi:hypothetical protein